MSESQNELQPLLNSNDVEATPVFPLIQLIRALTSPEVTIGVLQPLVDKYAAIQQEGNLSVVFCILLNRVHFIRDEDLFTATLSKSRADFCELLATRVFRENAYSLLDLTVVLTTVWHVYAGADPRLLEKAKRERDDELENRVGNAIELAILGKAKRFIKSTSCRRVIEAIWSRTNERQSISTILTKHPFWTITGCGHAGARYTRLAFVTFKNNLMVLSLRAMMLQFVLLMCIAMFCFCGFLYALWT
ncbi:hypothetical protein D9611_012451 [Ephemerocybe angulata]|uniref:YVC1 N-terminal linker helical domain-containing protein n=1 Tax=Ephemerocybe angulata TaxID=980116 RepID=A0A8H5FIS0_9AGAR|nr:hypothetical protein D9611_012451 [Tulosesus angulatus]